jgi:hypothetical protein
LFVRPLFFFQNHCLVNSIGCSGLPRGVDIELHAIALTNEKYAEENEFISMSSDTGRPKESYHLLFADVSTNDWVVDLRDGVRVHCRILKSPTSAFLAAEIQLALPSSHLDIATDMPGLWKQLQELCYKTQLSFSSALHRRVYVNTAQIQCNELCTIIQDLDQSFGGGKVTTIIPVTGLSTLPGIYLLVTSMFLYPPQST